MRVHAARRQPRASTVVDAAPPGPRLSLSLRLRILLSLGTWLLLTGLLFGQIVGVVLISVTTVGRAFYGQPLDRGLYNIPGSNDEPYSDRAVACVQSGRTYQPVQLSQLLPQQATSAVPDRYPNNGQHAYRVVSRDSFSMDAKAYYTGHCNTLSITLSEIFSACRQLGYNVTRDVLRIVDGVRSDDVVAIPKALPVLILPYWDANMYARYAVPSYDGSACIFRTSGMFVDATDPTAVLWGVNREARENKTATWLGYPGGTWRHGWYEDPVGQMRWNADVFSTQRNNSFGVEARRFDLLDGAKEISCSETDVDCGATQWLSVWGEELRVTLSTPWYHSIAISNGSRFGLFLYDSAYSYTMISRYSLERLISNASLAVLLAQWIVAMVALYPVDTIGLAALANAFSFQFLPLLLLPRLGSSLEGFWTAGCVYDSDQSAFANSWFTIYPAIGEVVLVYFSILHVVARLLRRRMSDVLFGPTLLFFVLLHRCRDHLADFNAFDGDRRVTGVVSAEEVDAASVLDYFATDLAFRVGGKVKTIYFTKFVVLGLNLVPLVLTSRRVVDAPRCEGDKHLGVEKALAIQFATTGGLGSTAPPIVSTRVVPVLRPYELVRAGYVVVGSDPMTVLISVIDWFILAASSCAHESIYTPFRVLVFDTIGNSSEDKGVAQVSVAPTVVSVGASSIVDVDMRRISARAFE